MTHISTTATPLATSNGLGRAARAVLRFVFRWLDAAEDRRHLQDMPDHMLRDIGLRRDQVEDALRGRLTQRAGPH